LNNNSLGIKAITPAAARDDNHKCNTYDPGQKTKSPHNAVKGNRGQHKTRHFLQDQINGTLYGASQEHINTCINDYIALSQKAEV
jgi:hypothetical protein